jgi:hypothetical protein
LRLGILIAAVLVVSLTSGWVIAEQFNPVHPSAPPTSTSVSVHVLELEWIPAGCGLLAHSAAGGYYKAGSILNVSLQVTNHNLTASCNVVALGVNPDGFLNVSSDLPLLLGPNASGTVKVGILVPSYSPPTDVTISVTAELQTR